MTDETPPPSPDDVTRVTGAGTPSGADEHPEQIGRYKILDVLGKGGMGVVYHAHQQHPIEREVALKTIITGMDSHEAVRRFESERQALARMEHSSIAKVFDAGVSPEGRLYFVMEYVDGVPIGEYCDRNTLGTEERLVLFGQVCRAIQHAHQKGIIHRDLKPSNVLVTESDEKPLAKVIDFGIAKATDDENEDGTQLTRAHDAIGTPAYMSPEQIAGAAGVDTRTDVYALGVMLYELLSGALPYETTRASGVAGLMERINTDAPPMLARLNDLGDTQVTVAKARGTTPQSLRKRLEGDLNWIVVKALERDLDRRYESAAALADDLDRHLADEPIQARAPTAGYRLQKFVRRNRVAVAAGVVVAVGLVVGATAATVGMVRAQRAEAQAAIEARTAERVSDFMVELFNSGSPDEAQGREVRAVDLLDRGAQRIRTELAAEPFVQARLMSTMGEAYRYLGFRGQALELNRDAIATLEAMEGPESPELATALLRLYDPDETDAQRRERMVRAHGIRDAALEPGDSLWLESFKVSVYARAGCTFDADRAVGESVVSRAFCPDSVGFEPFLSEIEAAEAAVVARHGERSMEAARSAAIMADLFESSRRTGDAREALLRAIGRYQDLGVSYEEALTWKTYANQFGLELQWDSVRAYYARAQELLRESDDPRAPNAYAGSFLTPGFSYIQEAQGLLFDEGRPQDARPLYEQAIAQYEKGLASGAGAALDRASLVSQILFVRTAALPRIDGSMDYELIVPLQRRLSDLYAQHYGDRHPGTNRELLNLARYTRDSGARDEAGPLFDAVVRATFETALSERLPDRRQSFRDALSEWVMFRVQGGSDIAVLRDEAESEFGVDDLALSDVVHVFGNTSSAMGRRDEGVRAWRRAVDLRRAALGVETGDVIGLLLNLANAEAQAGRPAEEERLMREAIAVGDRAFGPNAEATLGARNRLLGRLEAVGRYDEALVLYDEIIVTLKAVHGEAAQQISGQLVARGLIQTRVGRTEDAKASFEEALAVASSFGNPREIAQAEYGLALVAASTGDAEGALRYLGRVEPVWTGFENTGLAWTHTRSRMHTVRALAHSAAGDAPSARASFDRAIAAYDSLTVATATAQDRFWIQRPIAGIIADLRAARDALGGGP